uniref:Ubiquitin-like protease family profile domain-containing protein n=1 Tax=Oryza meridionalis TaxID=40149 RepID=A0A0E0DVK4_9ORYZ
MARSGEGEARSAVSLPALAAAVRRLSRAERGRRYYGSPADFPTAARWRRGERKGGGAARVSPPRVASAWATERGDHFGDFAVVNARDSAAALIWRFRRSGVRKLNFNLKMPKGLCVHVSKEHLRLDKMVRQKRSKLEDCSQSLSESDDIHSESLPNNDDNYQCDSSDNSDSHDMDVSQPHVNEISTNELLRTLKRKLSKSKRSEDDNIKMKRSESIELDNDVMINQVLRDIIKMDQIINSLKKKLNIHHNIGDQNLKDKNVDIDLKSDAFSRFSVKYFSKVLDSLSPHHKTVIENSCFRSMLLFDKCFVPNSFALWIAKQVDVNCSDIVLGQKLIPLNKQSVHVMLGLPVGGSTIHSKFDSGKQKILHIFGKTSIPSVKFFGEKLIKNEELPDDQILICFMIVSLNCFLCPNSSLIPSTKYLSAFEDMDLIESLDWCKLVFDWLMDHISKLEKSKTFGGCLFHLAVNYLDFLNFGSQKVLLDTPRIKVWKRSMIKDYSKFDKISEGVYGKRPVNDIASTCYQMVDNSSSSFADMLKSSVGDLLPSDVQDKICHLLCNHFGKEDEIFEDKAKKLLIDIKYINIDEIMTKLNKTGHVPINPPDETEKNSALTVIPDSYSPNPVLRNKITPRKLSQTFAAAVESPIICSDSLDKMYMVTLENSNSPTASLNENKENEKGCHVIKYAPREDKMKLPRYMLCPSAVS